MECFAKRIMRNWRYATRIFSGQRRRGREGGGGGGHFDKHFLKNTRKRGPAGKHYGYS